MKNFRPDKKLKRKNAWKRYRKTKNILDDWVRQLRNENRTSNYPPVSFPKKLKYHRHLVPKVIKLELKKKKQKIWKKIKTFMKKK